MRSLILGTAGHIDHGKTALVKALTGIDTDRLPEEKLRGISIDLGFASMLVDDQIRIGIVDVPGHERFIKNMLAGAGGIDFALFVVAADEGIMPQTIEHLDIINLLGVTNAIFAITKIDLVDDETTEAVRDEIEDLVSQTPLEASPMVKVSAKTGEGIEELKRVIADVARRIDAVRNTDVVRLPIDRVFSVAGWGTVVTGTLWSGVVRVGDRLKILPLGKDVKVRSIEIHGSPTDVATPGQRTAFGLHGVGKDEISRGDCLVSPEDFASSDTLDLDLEILARSKVSLKSGSRIRFHLGTSEVIGRVVLADCERLDPGGRSLAQVRLESPIVAGCGDRFVVRTYSPMTTIGGGRVLDPIAMRRRRKSLKDDAVLRSLLDFDYLSAIEGYVRQSKGIRIEKLLPRFNLGKSKILELLQELASQGRVYHVQGGLIADAHTVFQIEEQIITFLKEEQSKERLRWGIPRQTLRSNFSQVDWSLLDWVLERLHQKGLVAIRRGFVRYGSEDLQLGEQDRSAVETIRDLIKQGGLQPPSEFEIQSLAGVDRKKFEIIIDMLVEAGEIVRVQPGMIFHSSAIGDAKRIIGEYLSKKPKAPAGELKDVLGITRKHAIPLLEHLDRIGFTVRDSQGRRSLVRPIANQ